MKYANKVKELETEINTIIDSITSKLNKENDVFEFMWKEGVLDVGPLKDKEVSAIKLGWQQYSTGIQQLVCGDNIYDLSYLDTLNRGKLADIILRDKKYRIDNNFGVIYPEDMNAVCGKREEKMWYNISCKDGELLDKYNCNDVSLYEHTLILEGLGIEVPLSVTEIITRYHDVTYPSGIESCLSIEII